MACDGQNAFRVGQDVANAVNLIASITFPDITQNRAQVKISHDVNFPGATSVKFLPRGIFPTFFGDPLNVTSNVVNIDDDFSFETTPILLQLSNDPDFGEILGENFCLSENLDDLVTFEIEFEVEDLVCNINGEQAILGSWFPFIQPGEFEFFELDYRFKINEELDEFDFNFDARFQPFNDNFVDFIEFNNETNESFRNIFIPYSSDEIGEDDDNNNVDIFLFLGQNIIQNTSECISIEVNEGAAFPGAIIVLGVIVLICIIGCCVSRKVMTEEVRAENGRVSRRFRGLNVFPGSPDIILSPTRSDIQEETVVEAVLEENDTQDLDAAVPITTIDVQQTV